VTTVFGCVLVQNTNVKWQLGGEQAPVMLQGRYSARGGLIKGCTATLMFSRNNRKNISGTILVFRKKKFLSKTILRLGHKKFLT
jgi:hypothetical protein